MSRPSSSVTRWLLVVVGCAVLETAQPTKAAETAEVVPATEAAVEATPESQEVASPRGGDTLLIPGGSPRAAAEPSPAPGSSSWLVVLGLCSAGAGWWWWRQRTGQPLGRANRERQIQVEESRALGNRQYLVVASVGERKFLLGVTPGSIQMLTPLEDKKEAVHESVA